MTGDTSLILTVGVAVLLAAVHVFSPHLRFLDRRPRSIWLSIAGGVSVAYVFVHLLPELAHLQREHGEAAPIEGLLYLFALVGLVVFYGLERMAKAMAGGRTRASPPGAFWLHLGSFALYNVLIGYLLDEQAREEGTAGMILYGVAMGLHFVVNDRALYAHHGDRYLHTGRWLLAGAALVGWGAGLALEIPNLWLAGTFALLAGSVVLNVIKEELPEERESRFWAFALGTAGYAALLLAITVQEGGGTA